MLQVSPLATVAAKSDAIAAFDFRWLLNPSLAPFTRWSYKPLLIADDQRSSALWLPSPFTCERNHMGIVSR